MEHEQHTFDADINQLLSLIINSIYSEKEIFLRELISNASDAIEKHRYASLSGDGTFVDPKTCHIRIKSDKDANLLTITDSGIGMTRDELVKNLGTIAHSGTKNFLSGLKDRSSDVSQIGQFGVGFYSSFLVAKHVKVTSSKNGETWSWESDGTNNFNVYEVPHGEECDIEEGHGTKISLLLKDDCSEYLDQAKLKNLVDKHNKFVSFPIYLWESREVEREVPVEEETTTETTTNSSTSETDTTSSAKGEQPDRQENTTASNDDTSSSSSSSDGSVLAEEGETAPSQTGGEANGSAEETPDDDKPEEEKKDDFTIEDADDEDKEDAADEDKTETTEPKPTTKKVKETVWEWTHLNNKPPLWMNDAKDVTTEQYNEFYKTISGEYSEPIAHKHFKAEGQLEYRSIMYLPERPPFNFSANETKKNVLKLYVKRVFIMDNCEELLPEYLRFVKGVVDSEDLPLNVSRELLQNNSTLKVIKKNLTKKTIEMMADLMSADTEKYDKFYKSFSKFIKLGIHEDSANRDRLAKLLKFQHSKDDKWVTLQEYVDAMPEGQKGIYYLSGDKREALLDSPFLEGLTKRGYDVLFLTEPIDEYMVQQLNKFAEKDLVNVTKDGVELDDDLKAEDYKELVDFFKTTLGNKVESVKVSSRLQNTPCVLVSSKYGWSANMERIIKAQALRDTDMDMFMAGKKVMELNPSHPLVQASFLQKSVEKVNLLYQTSLLNSGYQLENPKEFVNKLYDLLLEKDDKAEETTLAAETTSSDVEEEAPKSTDMEQVD